MHVYMINKQLLQEGSYAQEASSDFHSMLKDEQRQDTHITIHSLLELQKGIGSINSLEGMTK